MISINTFIGGDPKGQPRPRAFARKMGSKHVARVYDSDFADAWKRRVDLGIIDLVADSSLHAAATGSVSVMVAFYFRRPKSHLAASGAIKGSAPRDHTQKPDIDNLIKLVADRITRNGRIWVDDSQITSITATKHWAHTDETSGAHLKISWEILA